MSSVGWAGLADTFGGGCEGEANVTAEEERNVEKFVASSHLDSSSTLFSFDDDFVLFCNCSVDGLAASTDDRQRW